MLNLKQRINNFYNDKAYVILPIIFFTFVYDIVDRKSYQQEAKSERTVLIVSDSINAREAKERAIKRDSSLKINLDAINKYLLHKTN